MSDEELTAAESGAAGVRALASEGSDVWLVTGDVLDLVAEVRRLRALLPASVEVPRSVRPALEAIFPRVARFAPPGTTSA